MALDRVPVVLTNVDVDANDLGIAAEQFEHRGVEQDASSARNSSLDYEVWFDTPDDLLEREDVLRKLNDRCAQPPKVVGVPVRRSGFDPVGRQLAERRVRGHDRGALAARALEGFPIISHRGVRLPSGSGGMPGPD